MCTDVQRHKYSDKYNVIGSLNFAISRMGLQRDFTTTEDSVNCLSVIG